MPKLCFVVNRQDPIPGRCFDLHLLLITSPYLFNVSHNNVNLSYHLTTRGNYLLLIVKVWSLFVPSQSLEKLQADLKIGNKCQVKFENCQTGSCIIILMNN